MGLAWTVLLNSMLGAGAYLVARSLFRQPAGLPRFFASCVLAWTWVILGCEFTSLIRRLDRPSLLIWAVIGLFLGVLLALFAGPALGRVEDNGADQKSTFDVPSRLALGLSLSAFTLLLIPSLLGPVKVVSDGPIYHLYFAIQWWKAGALELVPVPFGESASTYFPANGDLWFTWLVIGWGGDRLARIGQAPFLVLAAIVVYSLAQRLGARRSAAVIASCWFATCMPLLLFSFEANVDTIFTAGYLLACWFFLDYATGPGGRFSLALGALAAGAAWGTKPTGTVFVPPLLALAALGVFCVAPVRKLAARILDVAILCFLPLVTAGYWLARNYWVTGNPIYPADLPALGWVGWYQRQAMTQSPYFMPLEYWQGLADILLAVFDPRLVALWVLALLGVWRLARPGRQADRWVVAASVLAVLNIALYWFVVPYRTQQRFMLQGVALAALPLALLIDRAHWISWAAALLLAVHLLTAQNWPFSPVGQEPPWDFSPGVPNAVPGLLQTSLAWPWGLAALVVGGLAVSWTWAWALVRPRRLYRLPLVPVASLALLGLWGAFWWQAVAGSRFDSFYPPFADFYFGWLNLERITGPKPVRIAYAGTNIPYYLFGRNLRHDVKYVPIDSSAHRLLHEHHAQAIASGQPYWPNPRPGWDRLTPDFDAWLRRMRESKVDFLVVTRANPGEGAHNPSPADPLGFPIEREWADSHLEVFEPVYGQVEADPRFRVYRLLHVTQP